MSSYFIGSTNNANSESVLKAHAQDLKEYHEYLHQTAVLMKEFTSSHNIIEQYKFYVSLQKLKATRKQACGLDGLSCTETINTNKRDNDLNDFLAKMPVYVPVPIGLDDDQYKDRTDKDSQAIKDQYDKLSEDALKGDSIARNSDGSPKKYTFTDAKNKSHTVLMARLQVNGHDATALDVFQNWNNSSAKFTSNWKYEGFEPGSDYGKDLGWKSTSSDNGCVYKDEEASSTAIYGSYNKNHTLHIHQQEEGNAMCPGGKSGETAEDVSASTDAQGAAQYCLTVTPDGSVKQINQLLNDCTEDM